MKSNKTWFEIETYSLACVMKHFTVMLQFTNHLNSTSSHSSSKYPNKNLTRSSLAVDGCSKKSSPSWSPALSLAPLQVLHLQLLHRQLAWGRQPAAVPRVQAEMEPGVLWFVVNLGTARLRWFCRLLITRVLEERGRTTSEVSFWNFALEKYGNELLEGKPKKYIASSGNRTRAARVHSTTEPTMLTW